MEYRSQKIAYWYFAVALLLFTLQVVLGLWLAYNYTFTVPQSIVDIFPFSTARARKHRTNDNSNPSKKGQTTT